MPEDDDNPDVVPSETPGGPGDSDDGGATGVVNRDVISALGYATIAELYGIAQESIEDSSADIEAAFQAMIRLDPNIEVELLPSFLQLLDDSRQDRRGLLVPAVRTLNNHVVSRGDFASINEYLEEHGIIVPAGWARLCDAAGQPIDDEYVI